jgi:hypothetical protein
MIDEIGLEHVDDKSLIQTVKRVQPLLESDSIYQESLTYLYISCIQYCPSRITDNKDISHQMSLDIPAMLPICRMSIEDS